MYAKQTNLIWIDLEMTGLDPEKDQILELAIVITDLELNIIDDNFNVVIAQPAAHLLLMDPFVNDLHTKNGLINLVNASNIDLATAEKLALDFVTKYVEFKKSPMCGNSICLDRRFLYKFMPTLANYFHYRNLDVSSIKILANHWYFDKIKDFTKSNQHLAKQDILGSIAELKFYRDNIFIKQ